MALADYVPLDLIIVNIKGINFFAIFWYSVTLIVGSLGVFVLNNEQLLPIKLIKIYKFGKLNLDQDKKDKRTQNDEKHVQQTLIRIGVAKIVDLISFQVPKR